MEAVERSDGFVVTVTRGGKDSQDTRQATMVLMRLQSVSCSACCCCYSVGLSIFKGIFLLPSFFNAFMGREGESFTIVLASNPFFQVFTILSKALLSVVIKTSTSGEITLLNMLGDEVSTALLSVYRMLCWRSCLLLVFCFAVGQFIFSLYYVKH